jgi:hypothetical protein
VRGRVGVINNALGEAQHLTDMFIKDRRNISIDFFRGLALLWIFIDHTPGDWLKWITLKHIGA